ncbi:MAG: iron ABC transporter permease [Candidatus Promineifilaceae bacterium]|nr:iron ABC transporter permease [Candidatus Promineifilaceae bacterium]
MEISSRQAIIRPRFLRKRFPRASTRRRPQSRLLYWLFLAACGTVVALILTVPLYLIMRMVGSGREAAQLLVKASTLQILNNTILLAAAVTAAAILIALPVAWLTTRTDLPGRRIWTILSALPLVLPSYVAAYLFATILAPKGMVQQFLEPLTGLERMPSLVGFPGAFMVLTFITYPYILLTTRAALQRMDPAMVEAARSLGSSPWQAFRRVTFPALRPAIIAGSILVTLYVLRDFGAVTMWQYSTFTRVIYNRYLSYRLDTAAALAFTVVVVTVIILFIEFQARGSMRYDRLSSGAVRPQRKVALGHWKWPALFFLGVLITVTLILPLTGLSVWLWRGLSQDSSILFSSVENSSFELFIQITAAAWNSLSVSLIAAILLAFIALPISILVVRYPSRLTHLFERVTHLSYALPGLVVALALVFFGIQYTQSLYQSTPMLLAAYLVLFIPQAVGSQRVAMMQISPRLEEAGRSLGKRPWTVFRRITFPLMRPGILAGAALVFLTCMKELPATLILSPMGFSTLATQIWANINEAFFARAALPTLLLLLLSSLPLAVLTLREK